jgi:hypothetical protein
LELVRGTPSTISDAKGVFPKKVMLHLRPKEEVRCELMQIFQERIWEAHYSRDGETKENSEKKK